jgi:uncharacterized NAD(P)/FAD-binding protein YdhS
MDDEMPVLDTMDTAHERTPAVAVVGGGCAGTLVAANLLRRAGGPLHVVMIERSGRFGPGVAYSTDDPRHLLNVPARGMSAFSDQPLHFADWAASHLGESAPCERYLPRGVYGAYLCAVLEESRARARPRRTLQLIDGEAIGLRSSSTAVELLLADSTTVSCDRVVLATGALEGSGIAELPADPRVIEDPWAPGALAGGVPADCVPAGLTLVVGTGLSAVDASLSICHGGGRVLALSRGGQFPYAHLPGPRVPSPPPVIPRGTTTLARLERLIRAHVKSMQRQGYDWRDAIDGLRPLTPTLWAGLTACERRRFLRERLRAWERRRHRMAPAVGAHLHGLLDGGHVTLRAGSVVAARASSGGVEVDVAPGDAGPARTSSDGVEVDVTPTNTGPVRTYACERVVVCTGAGTSVERSASPLLRALLASGTASPDPLGLGLRSDERGALLDSDGHADGRVLTLGALRRGELWETTAVQEIRAQAEHLARTIELSPRAIRMAGRPVSAHGLATRPSSRAVTT